MSELKKPIEELLEASARARRAEFGADPTMPNPTRARLHDEIARQAEPPRRASWLSFSWPRIALAGVFASLVAATAVVWWQTQQNTMTSPRIAMEQNAPVSAVDRTEAVGEIRSKTNPQLQADVAKSEVTPRAAAMAGMGEKDGGPGDESNTRQLAKAAPSNDNYTGRAESATTYPAEAANSLKLTKSVTNLRQQFSQLGTDKKETSTSRNVRILDNFQVEQNGRDFRVVDDDGSSYAGRIEQLQPNDKRSLLQEKQSFAAAPATAAKQADAVTGTTEGEFYFHASGYNSSLKKSVVFEGNYIVTASPKRKDLDRGRKADESVAARIVGEAKISGEPPVPVEAITVPAK